MKKTVLKKYAELIVKMGVNVRKGQEVIINAGLDQPDFVLMVAEAAYKAGASRVTVDERDARFVKLDAKYMTQKNLSKLDDWFVARLKQRSETLPAMIYLESDDPDVLNGINFAKYAKAQQAKSKVIKPIRDEMDGKYQWCIAAVPGKKWAKKVFPDLRPAAAEEKLWEYILKCARADGNDPVQEWKDHNEALKKRCDHINSLGIKTVEIRSGNGTDLKIGLIKDSMFLGGCEALKGSDHFYNPNMPSEEIFISPKRGEAEGIVYSSRPFSYRGYLINSFSVRFENGKAVEIKGSTDKETEVLSAMINMDEGASYLGELALVPYSSPIRETEVVYYNTLFDENAACHLALGDGFENCLKDYEKYSDEEAKKMGINDSMIHEDFMIGTSDTEIVGIDAEGKKHVIFKKGEWAFKI